MLPNLELYSSKRVIKLSVNVMFTPVVSILHACCQQPECLGVTFSGSMTTQPFRPSVSGMIPECTRFC